MKEAAIKKYSTNIRIYWSDCDPAGIAYYGNFFRWFEIAEEELFLALGFSRTDVMHRYHIGFPRVEIWCRFRKPIPEGTLIEVTIWIAKRTQTALVFNVEIRREGESDIAAEAHYRLVCVKRPEFKPIPIPEEVLHLLRDYIPPLTKHSPEHKSEPRA
jgi:YbgC/YbaW family acyl-CoA thioester hydrolase